MIIDKKMRNRLESIYVQYNQKKFVDPDPLFFLYDYPDIKDREVVGLIAACLAYGQVLQIMKAVRTVLFPMGKSPYEFVTKTPRDQLFKIFKGFKYRFATENHLVDLLTGIKRVLEKFGSLQACFEKGWSQTDKTVMPGLIELCCHLDPEKKIGHLLSDPEKKSACKRSHLFLRWMVRLDAVDPGGWNKINPAQLIIPLDRHMHTVGQILGFTSRKSADLKTALEITDGFRQIIPEDPVKYDFCLTRYGIRNELNMSDFKDRINNRNE